MPSGKNAHHPGWKPLQGSANDRIPGWAPSPCRLPGPDPRYETCLRRVFTSATVWLLEFRLLDPGEHEGVAVPVDRAVRGLVLRRMQRHVVRRHMGKEAATGLGHQELC